MRRLNETADSLNHRNQTAVSATSRTHEREMESLRDRKSELMDRKASVNAAIASQRSQRSKEGTPLLGPSSKLGDEGSVFKQ